MDPDPRQNGDERATPDDQGWLGVDLPCLSCGYNLRGLAVDATCPECGTSVGWSVEEGRLWRAAPVWLRRLRLGLGWLLVGAILFVAGPLLVGLVGLLLGSQLMGTVAASLWMVLSGGTCLWGAWQVTTPEPDHHQPGRAPPRAIARWMLVPASAIVTLTPGIYALAPLTATGLFLGLTVLWLAGLVGCVGFTFLLDHLASLAPRARHPRLATETRVARRGIIAALVLGLGLPAVGPLAGTITIALGGQTTLSVQSSLCVMAVLYVLATGWSWSLLWRYRLRFRQAERWAGGS